MEEEIVNAQLAIIPLHRTMTAMTKKKAAKRRLSADAHLARVVDRNIMTLLEVRRQMDSRRTFQTRFADFIAEACGRPGFAYLHVAWFGAWVAWNTGLLGLAPFDPFPFGLLTMIVSLEAIFLSTFVLISQNRLGMLAEQRADLDLQINLLAEYEITKILKIVDAIADHLKLHEGKDPELDELEKEIVPDDLLREMELKKLQIGLLGGKKRVSFPSRRSSLSHEDLRSRD